VANVVQRLRWIPPGVFWMGSPEAEEGRAPDEGPRHQVTIEPGFWMCDTPCTQALWEAVMRENISHSRGPDRPVESVSWDECQDFLTALNSRLDGLKLSLPSEAQWEYACRAGTERARYAENLDAIAWYDEDSRSHTHSVGGKEPNSWGLYDMLGNVWEWCADLWTDQHSGIARAEAAESKSAHRVIRGGSWVSSALRTRAACRDHFPPSDRHFILGFRCAEFRLGS
jgi:formylglycine-generating enzyme required for sulfatase activity